MPLSFSTIKKILEADQEVRLYALNGLAATLASSIEEAMFWCYVASSGQTPEEASDKFYRHVRLSWKRPLTDDAVSSKLSGTDDNAPNGQT